MYTIEHAFLPVEQRDWVSTYQAMEAEAEAERAPPAEATEQVEQPARLAGLPLPAYAGTYRDPWFGEVSITATNGGLLFETAKSPRLSGPLSHHSGHIFVVEWTDRSLDMDAYVRFHPDEDGRVISMSMKRRVEAGNSDPDHFSLLDFKRIEEPAEPDGAVPPE
jgi:hypothetical protein